MKLPEWFWVGVFTPDWGTYRLQGYSLMDVSSQCLTCLGLVHGMGWAIFPCFLGWAGSFSGEA